MPIYRCADFGAGLGGEERQRRTSFGRSFFVGHGPP